MYAEPTDKDALADFTRRIRELRRSMRAADIDALVILSPSNLEYLTGIDLVDFQPMETSQGIGKLIYVSEDSAEFIYYAVTSPGIMNTVTWLDHVVYDQPEDPASVVARRISSGVRTLGVEGSFLPHNLSKRLEATLPAVELVDATRLVYELRMVKSDEEVSRVRRSARIADLAMVDVLPNIYGMREVDVAAAAMESMLGHGAHNVAYSPIVSSGERFGGVTYGATERRIGRGDSVMIDLGAKYKGYRSDFTRTSHFGPAPDALKRVRHGMLEARAAALGVMRAGVTFGLVDRTIREVLEDNGVDPRHLIHASHGIGIEVVEMPWLADQTPDVVLRPNVVMTLELIMGVPGVGAYTIEDVLVITTEGTEVFTGCAVPAYE